MEIVELSKLSLSCLYEDSFVLKGYPTPDGRPCYRAFPSEETGIVSTSDKKEGAWEFLEFYMSQNHDDSVLFYSRRTDTEKMLENWMETAYFDLSNGDPPDQGILFS